MSTEPADFAPLPSTNLTFTKIYGKMKREKKAVALPNSDDMLLILITGIWKLNGLGLSSNSVSGKMI